jgi:hypothetical protein
MGSPWLCSEIDSSRVPPAAASVPVVFMVVVRVLKKERGDRHRETERERER